MQGQVADEVAFVAEGLAAFGALVALLAGRRRNVVRIVVQVLVAPQQLLLPKGLVALGALVRFLVRVDQHVRLEVALRYRRVRAQVALEALFALVRFAVQLSRTFHSSIFGHPSRLISIELFQTLTAYKRLAHTLDRSRFPRLTEIELV